MSQSKSEFENDPTDSTESHVPADSSSDFNQAHGGSSNAEETEKTLVESKRVKMDDLKDRHLGEFRLLRRLGSGGMADVYLAEQTSLHRRVAVKVLRSELVSDEMHLKRFEQEAKAAGGLNHSNIVQVYMIGEQDGMHFIAQEYVQGLNLREYINRKGPPDVPLALHIMRQVAAALEAAGEAGIVHRDIKPENILISRKGTVKVADFGLAQLTLGDERVNLTQVGMTLGTPLYMSPEQVSGKTVDKRSDIYSFGVTCYHMLAGRPPFRGVTAVSIAVQHLNQVPEQLADRRPDLPPVLCQLVHRMMAKNPDDRYANALSLLKDLRQITQTLKQNPEALDNLELAEPQPSPPSQRKRTKFFDWSLKRQLLVFVLAFLLVGGISAAVGWKLRPGAPLATPPKSISSIRKLGSASEQYMRALEVDSEEAWLAVIENFGDDQLFRPRAKERLASLYLRSRRFDDAQTIFKDLSSGGEDGLTFKTSGLAGLAAIDSLRGKYQESQSIINFELFPIRRNLNPEMERLVQNTIRRNRQHLGDQVKSDYENLFQNEPVLDAPKSEQ